MSDKPLLRIINLKKRFGDKVVLDGFPLTCIRARPR